MTKMLLLLLATAEQKALGLHKNLVLPKNGEKGASCADAKSGGCKSKKKKTWWKKDRTGLLLWEGAVWWQIDLAQWFWSL